MLARLLLARGRRPPAAMAARISSCTAWMRKCRREWREKSLKSFLKEEDTCWIWPNYDLSEENLVRSYLALSKVSIATSKCPWSLRI